MCYDIPGLGTSVCGDCFVFVASVSGDFGKYKRWFCHREAAVAIYVFCLVLVCWMLVFTRLEVLKNDVKC